MSFLFQKLPQEIIFILKALHLCAVNNIRAGGNRRERLFKYAESALDGANEHMSPMGRTLSSWMWRMRIMIFEYAFWLYKRLYGFEEYVMKEAVAEKQEDRQMNETVAQ